jgi:hypothetical protein
LIDNVQNRRYNRLLLFAVPLRRVRRREEGERERERGGGGEGEGERVREGERERGRGRERGRREEGHTLVKMIPSVSLPPPTTFHGYSRNASLNVLTCSTR